MTRPAFRSGTHQSNKGLVSWLLRPRTLTLAFSMFLLAGCGAATSPSLQENQGNPGNQQAQTGSAGSAAQTNQVQTNNPVSSNSPAPSASTAPKQYAHAPAMQIDPKKSYVATVNTTDGPFTIQLFAKDSPQTVNNFIFLAKDHFYDNVQFFRIIKDFMIQTGDPLNNSTGGPGYTIPDELPPRVPYGPGIVAMANTGRPNSGGSQFFICTGPQSQSLPPDYTVFGKVVSGMNVVQTIAATPVGMNNMMQEQSKPLKDVRINSISIAETAGG